MLACPHTVWASMSWVDRLLPLWIIGAMVLGVVLGYYVPVVSHRVDCLEGAGSYFGECVG